MLATILRSTLHINKNAVAFTIIMSATLNFGIRLFFSSLLLYPLTSCSLFQGGFTDSADQVGEKSPQDTHKTETQPPTTSRVGIEDLKKKKESTLSDIEIVWQIPREIVEGFIIRFGYDKNDLNQQVRIEAKDLEKFEDPQHGFVYRYVIGDIPLGQVVYLSIAAFTGEKISKPTDIFEVAAEKFGKN